MSKQLSDLTYQLSSSSFNNHAKKCPDHPQKELEYFCSDCGLLVCTKCLTRAGQHNGHDVIELCEAFQQVKEDILMALKPLQAQLLNIIEALKNVTEHHEAVMAQRDFIESDITKTVDEFHAMIDQRKTELLSQLDDITSDKLQNLSAQRDQIKTSQLRLGRKIEFVDEKFRNSSQDDLILSKGLMLQQIKEIIRSKLQPECRVPIADADIVFSFSKDFAAACQNYGQLFAKSLRVPDFPRCSLLSSTGSVLKETDVDKESALEFSHTDIADSPSAPWSKDSLTCEIVSELTGDRSKGQVKRKGSNGYVVTYKPKVKGRHSIHVTVGNQHIKNSPFHVNAKLPTSMIRNPIFAIGDVNRPWGVAFSSLGELVVSEYGGHCISVFNSSGKKLFSFGRFGSEKGKLQSPCGVAVDSEGNIFVADSQNLRIQKFSCNGQFRAIATEDLLFSTMPLGLAFNPVTKNLYMVDGSSSITVINSDLTNSKHEELSKHGILAKANGIACDARGKVSIVDTKHHRVLSFTSDGRLLGEFGNDVLMKPIGIAVGNDYSVYVSDDGNRTIAVFSPDGEFVNSVGDSGSIELKGVRGVAVDPDGVVYVCDMKNQRVLSF